MLDSADFTSGLNTTVTVVFSERNYYKENRILVHWRRIKGLLVVFSLCMRKNLTNQFAPATSIFYNRKQLFCGNTFSLCFGDFFSAHASALKLPSPSCLTIMIYYKLAKIVAICQHNKRVLAIFSLRMRKNGYLRVFGQKYFHVVRSGHLDFWKTDTFPLPGDVYWIYLTFLCYYIVWPCDLDLWPFDPDSVSYNVPHMPDPHTNFYYPTVIGYWVMNYWI